MSKFTLLINYRARSMQSVLIEEVSQWILLLQLISTHRAVCPLNATRVALDFGVFVNSLIKKAQYIIRAPIQEQ